MTMMTTCLHSIVRWRSPLVAAAALFIFLHPTASRAQHSPNVLLYRGNLEFAGEPYSGDATIRFKFFPVPTGGTEIFDSYEDHGQTLEIPTSIERVVSVNRGQFSASLDLAEVVLLSPALYVQLEARIDGTDYPLIGRQRLYPGAIAASGQPGLDFSAPVGLRGGPVHITGGLAVGGTLTAKRFVFGEPQRVSNCPNCAPDLECLNFDERGQCPANTVVCGLIAGQNADIHFRCCYLGLEP